MLIGDENEGVNEPTDPQNAEDTTTTEVEQSIDPTEGGLDSALMKALEDSGLVGSDEPDPATTEKKDEAKLDTEQSADTDKPATTEKKDKPTDNKEDLYTEPEDLTDKSKQRFQQLVTNNKEISAELDTLKTQHTVISNLIETSQATPEEFYSLIEFSKAIKTGDYSTAEAMLINHANLLSTLTGKKIHLQPLAGNTELQAQVESGEVTEDTAYKLLQAQSLNQSQQVAAKKTQTAQQNQQLYEQEETAAKQALDGFDKHMRAINPDHELVLKAISEPAVINNITGNYRPSEWLGQFQTAYNMIHATIKATVASSTAKQPEIQKGSTGSVGTKSGVPKSAVDEIMDLGI